MTDQEQPTPEQPQVEAPQQEPKQRNDYKGELDYYRGMVEAQQQQLQALTQARQQPQAPQQPQLTESQRIAQQIQELQRNAPPDDYESVDGFKARAEFDRRMNELRYQQTVAMQNESAQQLRAQQVMQNVQRYKDRLRQTDPLFAQYEQDFDTAVANTRPEALNDQGLTFLRNNLRAPLLEQQIQGGQQPQQQQRRGPNVPPAPSGAYNRDRAPEPPENEVFADEVEEFVARTYGYTDAKQFKRPRPEASTGNGIQIYDFPEQATGRRRRG